MGFRINTNIAAMASHSSALANNRNLDNSLSKLSSGLRINKAADDASGLAIANSLRSQASSLGQAINNGNDAIGLIQTADGALAEYSNILDTIKTKAVQAASDGQNSSTRLAIQKDIDKLMEELNMIAKTTSFNGQKLLSGTYTNKEFQVGASSNETVKVNIASAETNKIGHTTRTTLDVVNPGGGNVELSVVSALTGKEINLKEVNVQFNNDPQNGMGALADELNRYSGETGIKATAVVESTTAVISSGTTGTDFAINGVTIGSVIVEDNDQSGSLLSAINSKTTETGVAATLNNDGSVQLTSTDGRAIEVTGDVQDVLGKSSSELSTLGHLELVQSGASDFQITNKSVGALSFDMNVGVSTMTEDSIIGAGSTLVATSVLKQGSTTGGNTYIGALTSNVDMAMTAGSVFEGGSIIEEGTTVGGKITNNANATMTSDMLLTKGSLLKAASVLAAGTVVTTAFVDNNSDVHSIGDVLTAKATVFGTDTNGGDVVLNADMILKAASATADSSMLAANSEMNVGSTVGADITVGGDTTTTADMTLKAGSRLIVNSMLAAGSTIGAQVATTSNAAMTQDATLMAGSTVAAASILAAGSTLGGQYSTTADEVLAGDMALSKGSTLAAGSILKAGTVLTFATVAGETGVAYEAGTTLKTDLTLTGATTVDSDMTLLAGSELATASVLTANDGKNGTIEMGETTNSSLADISVLTLDDAMKAIDTLDAAITNLDSIRSDLGSAQNQVVSTINNISVTQVNVKAAESAIRDVDFAQESANFSKFNILAQSGSYAMSQANAVQQNVMRLLQ